MLVVSVLSGLVTFLTGILLLPLLTICQGMNRWFLLCILIFVRQFE